jgi:hypothetical protein
MLIELNVGNFVEPQIQRLCTIDKLGQRCAGSGYGKCGWL